MTTKPSKKVTPPKQPGFPIWLPLIIVAGVVLIAVAVLSNTGSSTTVPTVPITSGAPALSVDKDKFDFGDVKLGQTVQVSFEVANTGDAPLRFKEKPYIEVAAGC
ncbi:MAG: DUF1573 domain-containing protein [Chloroflexi bacterium]|nr:DUF1573 domain-containing protein [Chloroflexota bacterium]